MIKFLNDLLSGAAKNECIVSYCFFVLTIESKIGELTTTKYSALRNCQHNYYSLAIPGMMTYASDSSTGCINPNKNHNSVNNLSPVNM